MTRPMVLYVDEAYKVLFGAEPPKSMTAQERMMWVMVEWDEQKLQSDQQARLAARLALCQIGLDWHVTSSLPYTFELIAERLRRFWQIPVAGPIDGRALRAILAHHGVRSWRR